MADELRSAAVEAARLAECPDARRLNAQLRRVRRALEHADSAGITAARTALDGVPDGARARPWTQENRALLVSLVLHHYAPPALLRMPADLLTTLVLSCVDVPELGALCAVSRDIGLLAERDDAWAAPCVRRFGAPDAATSGYAFDSSRKESFRQRLRNPALGDRVEVAWRGRFRLEGLEVYRGLAWWAAEVVARRDTGPTKAAAALPRYRVHYLHWDSRWDEWVARDQLRWPVPEGRSGAVAIGDVVDVWCSGHAVPGAWLRAVVATIEGDLYCVGGDTPGLTLPHRVLAAAARYASAVRHRCRRSERG
mmetsp:Transcript_16105/g.49808  ORF Transcript_16105/g.49808 Transcript_16105/m.49808 type:complete len:310 (-) Transcript_16105:63-992(-)